MMYRNAARSRVTLSTLTIFTFGPTWFERMDRNRDGEVSRREFLGPVDRFRELDLHADEAIEAHEAAGAK